MPSTSYKDTGARLYLSGYTIKMNGRVNWDSISRSNNTLSFKGVSATAQHSGSSFTFHPGWDIQAMVPTGTGRSSGYWTGSRSNGGTDTTGKQNFSIGVNSGTTSVSVRTRGRYRSDGWTYSSSISISVPALGSPSGTTTIQSGSTATSIPVRNNTTSWGSNATSGSVRSYRASNSSFSGQTYLNTSDNALITHTGLTSNTRYWFRGWSSNGGGKSSYHSSTSGYTLPLAPKAGTPVVNATDATIPTTQASGGGALAITNQVRWREVGGTWGSWVTYTEDEAILTDLLPSTEYQYQLRSTTTAGTTEGGVSSLTAMPAASLIMPDGNVVSAIPRVIRPDGSSDMVQVRIIQ